MWNKLSMAERAKYIQLAVQRGITDLNIIRRSYNSFEGGGPTNNNKQDNYTPATLVGWLTQLATGDNIKAAQADIGSSVINTGADAIPVFGNILGAVISAGDALYDTGKFIGDPSWSNATDVATSVLGIVPGVGSVKDAKNIAKAAKQTYRNVRTTKSVNAMRKTVTRKAASKNKARINVLNPNSTIKRSYPLQLTNLPYTKVVGTMGNWTDTAEDTFTGAGYLYLPSKSNKKK